MSERIDDTQATGLMLVAVLLIAVVVGTVTFGVRHTARPAPVPAPTTASSGIAPLVFEPGSAKLPAASMNPLMDLADAARASAAARVHIVASHDRSAGEAGVALARERAAAVRHALEANGVAPFQLQVEPPVATSAPRAQHVEMQLR